MRLLIISHTPHYLRDGEIVGWGATIRELDQLATLFDSVVHIAPLYGEPAPASAMAYESDRVRLHAVLPAGGERLRDKLSIALRYPSYARAILQERRAADVIHVRCPANISLLAVLLMGWGKGPARRWVKYAGNWQTYPGEPLSYRVQRWLLTRNWPQARVTVNGKWPNQPAHVNSFLNPCLTDEELIEGRALIATKQLVSPVNLLFVGRLELAKGVDVVLQTVARLAARNCQTQTVLVGDGPERGHCEQMARDLGIVSQVRFAGWLPRHQLGEHYARAHFFILPSQSEGWPKVLSEAMAYGVLPLASAVGSIPAILGGMGVGALLAIPNPDLYAERILAYLKQPTRWHEESVRAAEQARQFSYPKYLQAVAQLLDLRQRDRPPQMQLEEVG